MFTSPLKLLSPPRIFTQHKHIHFSFSCQLLTCLLRYSQNMLNCAQIQPLFLWHHQLTPSSHIQNTPLPAVCTQPASCTILDSSRQRWIAPCRAIQAWTGRQCQKMMMCIVSNYPPLLSQHCNAQSASSCIDTYWSHRLDNIPNRSLTWVLLLSSHKHKHHQWNKKSSFILHSQQLYTKLTSLIKANCQSSLHWDHIFFKSALVCCSWKPAFLGVKLMMHELRLVNHHAMCNSSNPYPCPVLSCPHADLWSRAIAAAISETETQEMFTFRGFNLSCRSYWPMPL